MCVRFLMFFIRVKEKQSHLSVKFANFLLVHNTFSFFLSIQINKEFLLLIQNFIKTLNI